MYVVIVTDSLETKCFIETFLSSVETRYIVYV